MLAVETVFLRGLLYKLDKLHGIDFGFLVKYQASAALSCFEFFNSQMLTLQLELGRSKQRLSRFRKQSEPIDEFYFEFIQCFIILRTGNSFVKNQSRVDICNVVTR